MAVLLLFLFSGVIQAYAQEITPEIFNTLRYRHIGPPGNRTSAVCGEPGNPLVYYIGVSSGGIWKSTDGANTWFSALNGKMRRKGKLDGKILKRRILSYLFIFTGYMISGYLVKYICGMILPGSTCILQDISNTMSHKSQK